jgi:hypothetical protein
MAVDGHVRRRSTKLRPVALLALWDEGGVNDHLQRSSLELDRGSADLSQA